MDKITFRFLINLIVLEGLDIHLINVIITYLYISINKDIYMKILEVFKLLETNSSKFLSMYLIKLQQFLHILKQYERI